MKLSVSSTNSQINKTWHTVILGSVKSYQYFYGTVKILVTKKKFIIMLTNCVTWIVINTGIVYLNKTQVNIKKNEERK
jgi:hypothetical protein